MMKNLLLNVKGDILWSFSAEQHVSVMSTLNVSNMLWSKVQNELFRDIYRLQV